MNLAGVFGAYRELSSLDSYELWNSETNPVGVIYQMWKLRRVLIVRLLQQKVKDLF